MPRWLSVTLVVVVLLIVAIGGAYWWYLGDGNPPGLDREALAAGRGAAPAQTVAQRQVEPIGL